MKIAIAADIGGTAVKYAMIDNEGGMRFKFITPTMDNPSDFISSFQASIDRLVRYAHENSLELSGVGIGVPAVVEDGKINYVYNIPYLNQALLEKAISSFGLPFSVENDANLMGLGEAEFGAARGLSDVVFLTIGTGIGGALILNGKPYGGYRNRGAELGHLIIHGTSGKSCSCGAKGCLEAHASTTALINSYRCLLRASGKTAPASIDGKTIVQKYFEGEPEAQEAFADHFDNLALGVTSLINIFAPQEVLLGGGITESGEFYIEEIRKRVSKIVMKDTSVYTRIDRATLGNDAGCYGAAALIFKA
jgi:glucokinase